MENDLVLHFELAPGADPNGKNIAQALLNWIEAIEAAAFAIDPFDSVVVEIIGTQKSSLRLLHRLRFLNAHMQTVSEGMDEVPFIKKAAIALGVMTGGAIMSVGMQSALAPNQTVEFGPAAREQIDQFRKTIEADQKVRRASMRFYTNVAKERAIVGVGVATDKRDKPVVMIPSREFAERSGLWDREELPAPAPQKRLFVWDVVLIKASLSSQPKTWRFSRDGLEFSAKVTDPDFLEAVKDGTLPIVIQEGVQMEIEVEFKERLEGQVWKYVEGSRKVTRVISPRPSA